MSIRLSRPSLSYQYPLAREDTRISPKASLAYPTNEFDPHFILSPNVFHLLCPDHGFWGFLTWIGHAPTSFWVCLCRRDIRLFAMRQQRIADDRQHEKSDLCAYPGRDADPVSSIPFRSETSRVR